MPAPAILRRRVLSGLAAAVAAAAVPALPGCSSVQPRLYVLTPMAPPATVSSTPVGGGRAQSVGVQLVTMPEYLDRPEIVSYASIHELATNRDDRWAERLPANVTRVLAENLSILLRTDRVRTVPARDGERFDHEVSVEFDRFERTAAGDGVLDAHWAVHDGATQRVLVRDQTHVTAHVPDKGYAALVAVMNENLTALSRDIAMAVAALPRKGGGRAGS